MLDPGDPPAPLSLPAVSGTLRAGETLTASSATWTGTEPIALFFQWQRCGPADGGCVDLPGETGATYLLSADDVDNTIRVRETGANLAGAASATSDATAQVAPAPAPPVSVAPPTIAGAPYLGWTLTAGPGAWSADPALAYALQWQRCDPTGADCADLPGETGPTYLLAAADLGQTIRILETATNEAGSTAATSEPTGLVIDPGDPPTPVALPTITGMLRVGQTLTLVPGTWTGTEPIAHAYQWQRLLRPVRRRLRRRGRRDGHDLRPGLRRRRPHDPRARDGREPGRHGLGDLRRDRPGQRRPAASPAPAAVEQLLAGRRHGLRDRRRREGEPLEPEVQVQPCARGHRRTEPDRSRPGAPSAPGGDRLHDPRRPQPGGRRPAPGLHRRRRRPDHRPDPGGRGRRADDRRDRGRDQGSPHGA